MKAKSARFLVLSDLHAHTHKRFSHVNQEGNNSRLQVALDVLRYIPQLAKRLGVRDVFFAGDLFETKGRVPVKVMNAVYRELYQWGEADLRLVMIPGNHDLAVRDGSETAIQVFGALKGVSTYVAPHSTLWGLSREPQVALRCVPYRDHFTEEDFAVPEFAPGTPRICLAHGLVRGSRFMPHDETPKEVWEKAHGQIRPSWLDGFDAAIVGHVHLPQVLGARQHILVPGQPYQQHPYDAGQRRSAWLVEVEGGRVKFTPHPIPCLPEFFLAKLTGDCSLECPVDLEINGNIILLQPEDHTVLDSVMKEAKERLNSLGAAHVSITPPALVDPLGEQAHEIRLEMDTNQLPQDVLGNVLSSGLVPLRGFAPQELQSEGEEILKEAAQEDQ